MFFSFFIPLPKIHKLFCPILASGLNLLFSHLNTPHKTFCINAIVLSIPNCLRKQQYFLYTAADAVLNYCDTGVTGSGSIYSFIWCISVAAYADLLKVRHLKVLLLLQTGKLKKQPSVLFIFAPDVNPQFSS